MGRAPCCDKANVKRGPWSPEEDEKLKSYIEKLGTGGNWIALPQKIGLKRCGKSCRLRWLNYLRPNIKHGDFTEEEDAIICSLYIAIGSRWSIIAAQLPGRTDNDIKNHWNTKLKKRLLGKQRKDQQSRLNACDQPSTIDSTPTAFCSADHQLQASICSRLLMRLEGQRRFSSINMNGAAHRQVVAPSFNVVSKAICESTPVAHSSHVSSSNEASLTRNDIAAPPFVDEEAALIYDHDSLMELQGTLDCFFGMDSYVNIISASADHGGIPPGDQMMNSFIFPSIMASGYELENVDINGHHQQYSI